MGGNIDVNGLERECIDFSHAAINVVTIMPRRHSSDSKSLQSV